MTVLKNSVLIATLATALLSTSTVMANASDTQLNNKPLNATDTLVEQIFKPLSNGPVVANRFTCPTYPIC